MAKFNTPPTAQQEEQIIDFSAFVRKYKRYWWLFLLSLVACISLAFLYLRSAQRVYNVKSVVLISQDDNGNGAGTNLLKSMKLMGQGSKVDDEMVVFSSQELCAQVVKQLKLNRSYIEDKGWFKAKRDHYNSSPVEIVAPEEFFDTLTTSLKFKIDIDKEGKVDIESKFRDKKMVDVKEATLPVTVKTPFGRFAFQMSDDFKPGKERHITASVYGNQFRAEQLNRRIKIKLATKKSNGINLSIAETNKSRGIDILNRLMDLYNERGQREKDEEAINTAKFIDERLALIYKGLAGSEADIEAFRRRNNMIHYEVQVKSAMAKQEMADNAIVKLETNKQLLGMLRDFLADPKNKHSYIPFDVDSSAASGSIKAYNNLLTKRQELEQSAKGDNLALKQIDEQMETLHANILKGVNTSIRGINVQLNKAQSQTNSVNNDMSKVPSVEREAQDLYRQQAIQNTLYTFLLPQGQDCRSRFRPALAHQPQQDDGTRPGSDGRTDAALAAGLLERPVHDQVCQPGRAGGDYSGALHRPHPPQSPQDPARGQGRQDVIHRRAVPLHPQQPAIPSQQGGGQGHPGHQQRQWRGQVVHQRQYRLLVCLAGQARGVGRHGHPFAQTGPDARPQRDAWCDVLSLAW